MRDSVGEDRLRRFALRRLFVRFLGFVIRLGCTTVRSSRDRSLATVRENGDGGGESMQKFLLIGWEVL